MLLWRNRTPNMPESNTTQSRSHEWIDQRSLAMGRAIAGKVRAQPALFQIAKDNLKRWIQQRQPDVPIVLQEWQEILTQWPVEKILDLLTSDDENARRLRQSSPFAGVLSQEERRSIFDDYEPRPACASPSSGQCHHQAGPHRCCWHSRHPRSIPQRGPTLAGLHGGRRVP